MRKQEPTLHPIAISQVMINFAASHGIAENICLNGTTITREDLQDGEALITREQEIRLIENLIQAIPEVPALGFKLGLQYSVSTFGVWGFALRTSRTLRDAANTALRYLPLSTAYCRMYTFEEDGCFGIGLDPEPIPSHLRQFLLERDLATGINLLKELSLSGLNICAAELQGPPPDYAELFTDTMGVAPRFQSSRNAMLVSATAADQPLPTFSPRLVRMLDDQCRLQLEQRQTSGLTGLVRQQVLGALGLVATLDEVASKLAMSPRSLRRKLEQEGSSFRAIVEEERRQTATQILGGSDMKLDELAIHLGYTDTASFTRAFRRWMGMSPGEYRRQNQHRS